MRGGWARKAFVVTEIALAVALVMGAGLLGRSLIALAQVDMGFKSERLVVLRPWCRSPAATRFPRAIATYRSMLDGAARDSRRDAGRRRDVAADRGAIERRLLDPGRARARSARHEVAAGACSTSSTPDYFQTLQVPIVRGRDFNDGDRLDAPFVAMINEQLAKDAFPDVDPIGRTIRVRTRLPRADDHRRHRQGRAHARSRIARCRPSCSCPTNSTRVRRPRSTS